MYARHLTHIGNSLVVFYPTGDTSLPAMPGSIKYIFEHGGKTFFALQCQNPAPSNTLDPFCHYPHFPAQLYCADLSPELEKVDPSWVVFHYAQWSFMPTLVVVLTLGSMKHLPTTVEKFPIH